MHQSLMSFNEVSDLIQSGEILVLAAAEQLLARLPKGRWIGGTIPYFVGGNGGLYTEEKIYVSRITPFISRVNIKLYNEKELSNIYTDGFENGFSVIIVPYNTKAHFDFALKASSFPKFGDIPLIGWIAGTSLEHIYKKPAFVFCGQAHIASETKAVVMHCDLLPKKYVDIGVINIFEQPKGEDTIEFKEDGFSVTEAIVNGKSVNFVDYLKSRSVDIRCPLVANYNGVMINTSYQEVDVKNNNVKFYAPIFQKIAYKQAKPVKNYVKSFLQKASSAAADSHVLSFNCILNYLYGELEGKACEGFTFPCTFGEIAYQLLNQTLVYLAIKS